MWFPQTDYMNTRKYSLLLCLSATKELLSRSENDGWPDESPVECYKVICGLIDHLFDDKKPIPEYWSIQFAPTGPIQEIALSNGWHDAYMELSKIWDTHHIVLTNEGDL